MSAEPLRIVYLIGQLGLGGSERQLYLLLKHMDKTRFELHVVVFNPSPNYTFDDELGKVGIAIHTIPPACRGIAHRMIWIFQLLRRLRPDVVHSWSIHDNVYAGIVGKLAGVPIRLGSVRDSLVSPEFLEFSPLVRWLILHTVQSHLVNSVSIEEEMKAAGVASKRICTLPNCVDTSPLPDVAVLQEVPYGARIVGMVANLHRKKNHLMFVRGLAQVLPEFPNVYGVIIGQPLPEYDPELPGRIRTEIISHGMQDRILHLGFHTNVPALLPGFEIFCLPTNFEGTPNVILEAMAAGLPVIATRVSGIPHIVEHGVTGLLIEPGDVNDLVKALRTLLGDPQKAQQMGVAGRTRVEMKFSCETVVPHFEDYYFGLMDPASATYGSAMGSEHQTVR
jgi:glycosyltransferase involved in cell wall biosynthesis